MPETKFVDEEELEGKTIAKVARTDRHVWLLFTDGTYTGIEAAYNYGDPEVCFDDAEYDEELLAVGLITQEQIDAKEKASREHQQKCDDAADLQKYLKLKRKFEARTSPRPSSPSTAPPSPRTARPSLAR
jgi:hypothetical protein